MTVISSRYAKYSKYDPRDGWQYTMWGQGAAIKIKRIRLSKQTTAAETDTGWDLPAGSFVMDAFIKVITAEATESTKTIEVGLLSSESGGDADGFLDAVSVAATGLVKGGVTVTVGGTETFYAANPTKGALLRAGYIAGTNSGSDFGLYQEKWHDTDSTTARSVTWTASGNQTEFSGDLYIMYMEVGTHE